MDRTPGPDYRVQHGFGQRSPVSNVRNAPSFGIPGGTDSKNKVVISSQHVVDKLGKDSPSVGAYNNDIDKLYKIQRRNNVGSMAFSKARRFKDDRSKSPHQDTNSSYRFNQLADSKESLNISDAQLENLRKYKELKARKNTIDL